jgi:hypothetical protein
LTKPVRIAIFLATAMAVLAPAAGAQAATVNNGGFETGTPEGWQTTTETPAGEWLVISGTEAPISENEVPGPFSGSFDAVADEEEPAAMVLYQDVALPADETHELSLELNYRSQNPIVIPSPDTLAVGGEPNQQLRVDVMKAGSPVSSLNPKDILVPVFATKEGDPEEIGWTHLTANLSPFAGETVRIRIALSDNQDFFNAGVDAVSITSTPISHPLPVAQPSAPATTSTPPPAPLAPTCTVPKLVGKRLKAAKKRIRAADCKVGHVGRKKGVTARSGKVVRQRPKPGAVLPAGSKVSLKLG